MPLDFLTPTPSTYLSTPLLTQATNHITIGAITYLLLRAMNTKPTSTITDFGEAYHYPTRVFRTSKVLDSEAGIIFYGSSTFHSASILARSMYPYQTYRRVWSQMPSARFPFAHSNQGSLVTVAINSIPLRAPHADSTPTTHLPRRSCL